MIEQFQAVSYRGLRGFSLDGMRRVNVVTGPNGVGKSSLAEALWLFDGRYNPTNLFTQTVQRLDSSPGLGLLAPLGGSPVELRGREDGALHGVRFEFTEFGQPEQTHTNGSPRSGGVDAGEEFRTGTGNIGSDAAEGLNLFAPLGILQVEYGPDGPQADTYRSEVLAGFGGLRFARPLPRIARPPGALVNRDSPFPVDSTRVEQFSSTVARGEKRRLLNVLRLIRPAIEDIEILTHLGQPSLWADVGEPELLPLEAVGGGMVRLLGLLVTFFSARGGLVIVDEIENGIHHSALQELWRQILGLSETLDVQVVATTHSLDCVKAAVAVADAAGVSSDLAVHQMYRTKDGERRSATYADDKLGAALDLGLDIR